MPHTPNPAPLDNLLRQSLSALARSTGPENEVNAHLLAALTRIARYFRSCTEVFVQCVIEQDAASVAIEGRSMLCPRLLVQCTRRDFITSRPLTLIYMPVRSDRIGLRIGFGDKLYEAAHCIQWVQPRGVWSIASAGDELHRDSHASFLRKALYDSGLFTAQTMALEPLHG